MSLGAGRVFVSEMGEEEVGELGQQGQLCRSRESGNRGRGQATALWEPAPRGPAGSAPTGASHPERRRRWTVLARFLLPKGQGQCPTP